jgi:hypothetical protein
MKRHQTGGHQEKYLTASIIRAMLEAASTSETRLHGATIQKTATFILAAVRTSNLTQL